MSTKKQYTIFNWHMLLFIVITTIWATIYAFRSEINITFTNDEKIRRAFTGKSASNSNMIIPKIIHQTWVGPKSMPLQLMNAWNFDYIEKCNGYQYILWSDMRNLTGLNREKWDIRNATNLVQNIFVEKRYEWYNISLHYFSEVTWHGKSDILRLIVLYLYGGIYIDADSAWINNKCLNPLLSDELLPNSTGFAASEPGGGLVVANGVMGFTKNNKIVESMIKYLVLNYYYERTVEQRMVWQVTGPCLLNKFKQNITIFPSQYFYPLKWRKGKWKGIDLKQNLYHKKFHFSNKTYMFQYGFSSNKLKWRRRLRKKKLWHSCYPT